MGKTLKKDNRAAQIAIATLSENLDEAMSMSAVLGTDGEAPLTLADGRTITITKEMLSFNRVTKRVTEEKYLPHVIEPSFGIGRILMGVMEHAFSVRSSADAKRTVLSFKPLVAPVKVTLLNLDNRIKIDKLLPVRAEFNRLNVSSNIDVSSNAIGRRYARADELGTPFCITIDFNTATDDAVTLRERDSCAQIRLPIVEVAMLVRNLADETVTFPAVMASGKYTVVTTGVDKVATTQA